MISRYLYELFTNAPVFRQSVGNETALAAYFDLEILKVRETLNVESDDAVVNHLLHTSYAQLKDLFTQYPLLEIFYLVNSFGEYKAPKESYDSLGRFKYEASMQKQIGITQNAVLKKMLELQQKEVLLSQELKRKDQNSTFYLSHDIDSINGALLQDGLWALKNFRPDVMMKVFFQALFQCPEWLNMDLIMKTESEYDFKSAFYWIVNKGRIDKRQSNADYYIDHKDIVRSIQNVEKAGFENGLHKSLSPESFARELNKLPFKAEGNRYHYLKFRLPDAYRALEGSGLRSDASLGFAEQYGFRNSYGFPFHPYNMESGKAHQFLEIPLNVMDGTFERYMKLPVEKTASTVIQFLEENRQNALISILWHNTFFTNYKFKGYREEYKKILAYLKESNFTCKNLKQITEEYTWKI